MPFTAAPSVSRSAPRLAEAVCTAAIRRSCAWYFATVIRRASARMPHRRMRSPRILARSSSASDIEASAALAVAIAEASAAPSGVCSHGVSAARRRRSSAAWRNASTSKGLLCTSLAPRTQPPRTILGPSHDGAFGPASPPPARWRRLGTDMTEESHASRKALQAALSRLPHRASMPVAERYRTVPEIAAELLVSKRTIYRAIERGELQAIRVGTHGRIRVPIEALEALIRPARGEHDHDDEEDR